MFAILYGVFDAAGAVRWDYEIIIRDSFAPVRSPQKYTRKINYLRFYRGRRFDFPKILIRTRRREQLFPVHWRSSYVSKV